MNRFEMPCAMTAFARELCSMMFHVVDLQGFQLGSARCSRLKHDVSSIADLSTRKFSELYSEFPSTRS